VGIAAGIGDEPTGVISRTGQAQGQDQSIWRTMVNHETTAREELNHLVDRRAVVRGVHVEAFKPAISYSILYEI
jgi:hypothetical protein